MSRNKSSSGDCYSSRKLLPDKRYGRVKCKTSNSACFYGKYGRRYTLSGRAQEVLSTVLEDMIEETLEDARKFAQNTGKEKVAVEDVEMAMVNLCQRLQPHSNTRPDDTPVEFEPPAKSQQKIRHLHRHRRHEKHSEVSDTKQC